MGTALIFSYHTDVLTQVFALWCPWFGTIGPPLFSCAQPSYSVCKCRHPKTDSNKKMHSFIPQKPNERSEATQAKPYCSESIWNELGRRADATFGHMTALDQWKATGRHDKQGRKGTKQHSSKTPKQRTGYRFILGGDRKTNKFVHDGKNKKKKKERNNTMMFRLRSILFLTMNFLL